MQLDQCAQIAASLPLLGIEENPRVTKAKVHIVTAPAPLPLAVGKLDVVPELATSPPTTTWLPIPSVSVLQRRYIRHVTVQALLLMLVGMWLVLQGQLLSQHRRLLLPLQGGLSRGCGDHDRLAAISAHVRLVAGTLNQLAHGAGLCHRVGHAGGCDGVDETSLPGIWKEKGIQGVIFRFFISLI